MESVLFTLKQDRFQVPYFERILIGTRSEVFLYLTETLQHFPAAERALLFQRSNAARAQEFFSLLLQSK
ncbi:hypothetical protein ACFFJ7_18410 [Pseudochelatococcus lubricantis]|uniref:hypothetical protein n=1 Tax=Pseudochelatococcus lubricantis TaxID=1538102 RepID=UPI0035E9F7E3